MELIHKSIHIKALQMAQSTHDFSSVDDYEQEMRLYCLERLEKYDWQRSAPQTFIDRITESAKLQLLRKLSTKKNIVHRNTERLSNE